MIYSVVGTDRSDYIHWQVELLEYSWSRVNQPGELLRLVACEPADELPVHRYTRVIRTLPRSIHPQSGDHYIPYNRLFSMQQWLDEHQPSGTALILDPDCVFRRPIRDEVAPGRPIAQTWLRFGISEAFRDAIEACSDVDIEGLQAVTWPAYIDCGDLRRLMPRWIEITAAIRDRIGRWESDMFGFIAAAAEIDLTFDCQNTTAWTPWPDEDVGDGPLVHYCQKIQDAEERTIWWKQDYRIWERVAAAESAQYAYCRDLLRLVDEHARVRESEQQLDEHDTIFIAIAAYCEPELADTIESCLNKARRPERLRFGICQQYDDSDPLTASNCLDRFSQDRRIRYVKYPFQASRGGSWARNIAQQLYDGERYTLQIDAHSHMRESWDVILIDMLRALPSDKPLITAFPPLYYFEDGRPVYQHIDDFSQVNTMLAETWNEDGSLHHPQKIIPENNVFPRRTRILCGALVFTYGQWNEEVRQDPEHFYTGEEFALTLRSFTHGYDLFDPSEIVLWHRLHPQANRKFWHDNPSETVHAIHGHALERLRWLFEGDPNKRLGRYGLGGARTLEDFHVFSGLDCRTYSIHPDARAGVPPDPVTLQKPHEATTTAMPSESRLLDLRIHLKNMEPLELMCEEHNPIVKLLFQSQLDKHQDADSVIYLNVGAQGEEEIRFKKSSLLAIESDPPLADAFLSELTQQAASAGQSAQAESPAWTFSDEWKYWIWHNIHARGCSRDVIFKELIQNDFPWEAVRGELNYEPSVPLESIRGLSDQQRPNRDKLLLPHVRCLNDHKLEVYGFDRFLTPEECAQFIEQINSRLVPSTTAWEERTPEVRTSQTCFFEKHEIKYPPANELTRRVARLLGIDVSYAEPLQGHIYRPGEEYKAHTDCFAPGTKEFDKHANDELGGQRTWSMLIYLNDVEEGGATEFPEVGLSVKPAIGKAVFWNNLLPSGAPNLASVHRGKPPESGSKILLSQWFRSIGSGEMWRRDPQEYIPAYTAAGFELTTFPKELLRELRHIVEAAGADQTSDEHEQVLKNPGAGAPSQILDIPEPLRQRIFEQLQPICEAWSGQGLLPSAVYGIRRYHRGTSLDPHRDRPKSHIISAILNIAQRVDEEWPLSIEDHYYRRHDVILRPGDMLLYEGARLAHGRPAPLQGDYYCNVFVHYRPVDYVVPEAIEAPR